MTLKLVRSDTIFPVPLLTFELEDSASLNRALEAEIAARAADEPSMKRSNRGGWHSASDLFARAEPAHRQLCEAIAAAARQASEQWVPGLDWTKFELILDGWANVSEGQDYHSPHDHPNAFWSGVYYVALPPAEADSGAIEFLSGRAGNPYAGMLPAPMSWDYLRVRPKPGFALLFPGHLKHWVTPTRSPGKRISVAFNAAFRARG